MPYMQGAPVYARPPQQQPTPRYAMPQTLRQPQATPSMPPPPPMLAANNIKPKVRAQAPDATPPNPPQISLPSPEALGIQVTAAAPRATAPAPAVDWNQIHARLEQLGIVNLHRDRLPQGGFRVTLALPGQQPVEGIGATEAAAMMAALQRAQAVVAARR